MRNVKHIECKRYARFGNKHEHREGPRVLVLQAIEENDKATESCERIRGKQAASGAKCPIEDSSKSKAQEVTTRGANAAEVDLVECVDEELDQVVVEGSCQPQPGHDYEVNQD